MMIDKTIELFVYSVFREHWNHAFKLILRHISWFCIQDKKISQKAVRKESKNHVSHKSAVNFVFYIFTFYFKGNPTYIDSPSIIFPPTSKVFELGEVLQLQCFGEKDFSTQTDTVKYHLYICINLKGKESKQKSSKLIKWFKWLQLFMVVWK